MTRSLALDCFLALLPTAHKDNFNAVADRAHMAALAFQDAYKDFPFEENTTDKVLQNVENVLTTWQKNEVQKGINDKKIHAAVMKIIENATADGTINIVLPQMPDIFETYDNPNAPEAETEVKPKARTKK